jgi:hypothetical protein
VVPIRKMAPRDQVAVDNVPEWDTYGPPTSGLGEAVFFFDLAAAPDGRTQALLHDPDGRRGVSLKFSKKQFPCFTLWKNRQAESDGYVTGLEPAINFPNARSFEKDHGRVTALAAGETRAFELTIEAHPDAAAVRAAQQAVAQLQAGVTPQILDRPHPAWSRG